MKKRERPQRDLRSQLGIGAEQKRECKDRGHGQEFQRQRKDFFVGSGRHGGESQLGQNMVDRDSEPEHVGGGGGDNWLPVFYGETVD